MFESEDVRALVDLGFIAIGLGLDEAADRIFSGVRALRPDQEAGYIGDALVRMTREDFNGATKVLRPLPPTDSARLFLGMALMRGGEREEAGRVLGDVARRAENPAMSVLATSLIEGAATTRGAR
ncbi:MAG: hypothetical protein ACR652_13600 [Methylocystis sp.]|uniref:hypothetical protein n=1 Tax=Methylocystis sp. TaxID=1911079 RepID=UPI003DA28138